MSNIIAVTDANFETEVEKHDGSDHRRLLGDLVRPVPDDRADPRSARDGVFRESCTSPSWTSTRTSRRVRASTSARSRRCCSSRAARSSIRSSAPFRRPTSRRRFSSTPRRSLTSRQFVVARRCARVDRCIPLDARRFARHLRADMPASLAALRFPYSRVVLPRTRLAYVHLRNLLTDAKRDRSARISGYVAISLLDELVMFYLLDGEVVNATVRDPRGCTRRRDRHRARENSRASRSTARSASTRRTRSSSPACSRRSRRAPDAVAGDAGAAGSGRALSVSSWRRRSTASSRSSRTTASTIWSSSTARWRARSWRRRITEPSSIAWPSCSRGRAGSANSASRAGRRFRAAARPGAARRSCRRIAISPARSCASSSSAGATARRRSPSMRASSCSPSHPVLDGFSFDRTADQSDPVADTAELTDGVAAWIRDVLWAAIDHDADPPEAHPARAHLGSAAHVPVRRSLRADAVESGVSDDRIAPARCTSSAPPSATWGIFLFARSRCSKSVSAILAEDTRHTRHLLDALRDRDADDRLSRAQRGEDDAAPRRAALTQGESLALVSDAGTPLLSDPGSRLVAAAIDAGIRVVPVPGASALLAALVASGLDADRFTFFGFLTRTGSERRGALDEISALRHTAVVYESRQPAGGDARRARAARKRRSAGGRGARNDQTVRGSAARNGQRAPRVL